MTMLAELPDPAEWAAREGRGTPPPGTVFVWTDEIQRHFVTLAIGEPPKPCRAMKARVSCRAPSVAKVNRAQPGRPAVWWHYCADHLFGRVIVDGVLWRLTLADIEEV